MSSVLITILRDFGFPALVAAWVLFRLDARLAHVEMCLVRICAILSASTGIHVEDLEEVEPPLREPSPLKPVPKSVAGNTKEGA